MCHVKLADIFEGAAAKYLSVVDAEPKSSNQHEFGGLTAVGFNQHLGTPVNGEKLRYPCKMIYVDDEDANEFCEAQITWYDSRFKNLNRSPEYRLYYPSTRVTERMKAGDFFLITKQLEGDFILIFAPAGSTIEQQLKSIWGLSDLKGKRFTAAEMRQYNLVLPLRLLLEEIGIEINLTSNEDGKLLNLLESKFPHGFPKTHQLSQLARELEPASPIDEPDITLVAWMEKEEKLFRLYERKVVAESLKKGFGEHGDDVDKFISFSLSVQNRRKSRVGFAFENHLRTIFSWHSLKFEMGSSKLTTENRSKPDFLFPSFSAYHNPDFPDYKLKLLGAKTTCKDRWRQVLSEGKRIERKHLITLQPAISEYQLNEMVSQLLQLVVPLPIQETYLSCSKKNLQSLCEFINEIKKIQKN